MPFLGVKKQIKKWGKQIEPESKTNRRKKEDTRDQTKSKFQKTRYKGATGKRTLIQMIRAWSFQFSRKGEDRSNKPDRTNR